MNTNKKPEEALKSQPTLVEKFAENGQHSHWELTDTDTGKVLWNGEGAQKNQEERLKAQKSIKEKVLSEYAKGNIVVATFEGLQAMPIKDFIEQPTEGILYDLNRLEAVVLTFIHDPKWINDYAVAKVIQLLKSKLSEQTGLNTKFLLHLVDTVWSDSKESQEVPATIHAQDLIKKATETFLAENKGG